MALPRYNKNIQEMKKLILLLICFYSITCSFCQTQTEVNEDVNKKLVAVDKELNETYQKILIEYKEDTAFIKNLKASQRIWIKFRDAEVKMKYPDREPGYYGSTQTMCRTICLTELTQSRINILKVWLEGVEEGDVCSGSVKVKN